MPRLSSAVAVLAVSALVLSACGGDGADEGADAPAPAAALEAGEAYLSAFAEVGDATIADMIALSAPGSPAGNYAVHTGAVDEVQRASGEEPERRELGVEGDTVVVTFTPTGGNPIPTRWSDFEVDDSGLLTSFTIDGVRIDDRIVLGQDTETADGVTISVVSAFELVTNDSPVVVLQILNGSGDDFVLGGATYVAPDGTTQVSQPSGEGLQVSPGEEKRVVLIFGAAPFGGTVTASGIVGDQPTEHQLSLT